MRSWISHVVCVVICLEIILLAKVRMMPFVVDGLSNWNKQGRLGTQVGLTNSFHNIDVIL